MNRWVVMLMVMGCLVGGLPEAHADEKCTGWIAVESVPADGGSITLDGVETSRQTPATLKNVPCGLHEVGIALPDFRDFPRRLRVKKNQVHKVRAVRQQPLHLIMIDRQCQILLLMAIQNRRDSTACAYAPSGSRTHLRSQFRVNRWNLRHLFLSASCSGVEQ